MPFAIQWNSHQGTRTDDNRDHAAIAIRGDSVLVLVLDGSTTGPASGAFAREIAGRMLDWFMNGAAVTAESLTGQLRATHAALAENFKGDSASYVILYAEPERPVFVSHAGDCIVGRPRSDGNIDWLSQPHTLANALSAVPHDVIAKEPSRHFLTRNFRSRSFMTPDFASIELDDRPLLVATDGFWAELDPIAKGAFLEGRFSTAEPERDDQSVLSLTRASTGSLINITGVHDTESIQVRHA
ncbi:hypothetical protein AJ87_20050 [Rhizobium yanglingense]|nr:hypothetical protein AJ87_20050 [Rhizobium yanglingense]